MPSDLQTSKAAAYKYLKLFSEELELIDTSYSNYNWNKKVYKLTRIINIPLLSLVSPEACVKRYHGNSERKVWNMQRCETTDIVLSRASYSSQWDTRVRERERILRSDTNRPLNRGSTWILLQIFFFWCSLAVIPQKHLPTCSFGFWHAKLSGEL